MRKVLVGGLTCAFKSIINYLKSPYSVVGRWGKEVIFMFNFNEFLMVLVMLVPYLVVGIALAGVSYKVCSYQEKLQNRKKARIVRAMRKERGVRHAA